MLTRTIEADTMYFREGDSLVFSIEEQEGQDRLLMLLKGELRSDAAHHIQDELDAFATVGLPVTVDLKEVTFAAPSILNALLCTQQLIDALGRGQLVLRNIPDAVYREMDDTGITELLMIED